MYRTCTNINFTYVSTAPILEIQMHQKTFSTRTLINTSDIPWNFRPYKGADVGEGASGTHNKNLAVWNFRYGFNILKD